MSSEPRPERDPDTQPEAGSGPEPAPEAGSESGSESGSEHAPETASGSAAPPAYADRCYRSPAALAGGVVLLGIVGWLGCDALFGGSGRERWIALAGMVLLIPLVVAFTLRPAVYANEQRLRVRNPFRTVIAPWGVVESVRSSYSSEFIADGNKYQLWSIPVSLRARKRASRRTERASRAAAAGAAGAGSRSGSGREPRPSFGGGGLLGFGGSSALPAADDHGDARAPSDQAIDELRELALQHGEKPYAQGSLAIRWAYEIVAPTAAGAIALAVLLGTR